MPSDGKAGNAEDGSGMRGDGLITLDRSLMQMHSLLNSSFRHRFVIPTNEDVGASRVKGRSVPSRPRLLPLFHCKFETPVEAP